MTYLQLCVRLRQEAGIAGSGPTQVVDQSGQLLRIVNWIAQAWEDIQIMRPNWKFMHEFFTFDTEISTRDYLPADVAITDLNQWDTGSFFIYEDALGESDENSLRYTSYGSWRTSYRSSMANRAEGRPQLFTLLPDNPARMEPVPDKVFKISGEYKRVAQLFTADGDEPTGLLDDFHMLIVWSALKSYAYYENASEVLEQAEMNFDHMLTRLEIEQLPDFNEDREGLA